MSAIDQIIDWASKEIPAWQGDAVRRMLTQVELTESDKNEILEMLKIEHGISELKASTPSPKPIQKGTVSGAPQSKVSLIFKKLDDVKNVNAIPDGSYIPFAHEGLTVIYGENGAGKSGYARVLKRACSAKDTKEPIHPNVFAGQGGEPASAKFKIQIEGQQDSEVIWVDNGVKNDILTNVVVFDSRGSSIIVDEENDVSFLPHGTQVFNQLAELLKEFKTILGREKLPAVKPDYKDVSPTSLSGKFIASINFLTEESDLIAAANWLEKDTQRLSFLKARVAEAEAPDRNAKIRNLKTIVSGIAGIQAEITKINLLLSKDAEDSIKTIIEEFDAAEQGLAVVAEQDTVTEPLPGVGSKTWEKLYLAAQQFSISEAYVGKTFPVLDFNGRCVLCMQLMLEDTKERFKRFQGFMEQTTKKSFDDAVLQLKAMETEFNNLNFDLFNETTDLIQAINDREPQTVLELKSYASVMKQRFEQMKIAVIQKKYSAFSDLVTVSDTSLSNVSSVVKREVAALETITHQELKTVKDEVQELESRRAFNGHKDETLTYLRNLKRIKKYEMAIDATGLQSVSARGKKIISEALTPELQKALKDEMKLLGASYMPIDIKPTSVDGEVVYKLTLTRGLLPRRVMLSEVLSEGEQRVIGVAGFLADVSASETNNPIVFDDPVSSLDHKFRDKIAFRLVKEAKKRQVIVFTHDIAFLLALEDHAIVSSVKMAPHTIYRKELTAGHSAEGLPWHAMNVGQRLDYLVKKMPDFSDFYQKDMTKYNESAARFYGMLRETWEALVEETLLNNVIRRHGAEIKTLSLSGVEVSKDDYRDVFFAMGKCSTWMTGHDKSKALSEHRPDPLEIKADIEKVLTYKKTIKDRSKIITKERVESLEVVRPDVG